MSDYIVSNYIDSLMRVDSSSQARDLLEVADSTSFSNLNTLVQTNSANWEGGVTKVKEIYGDYIITEADSAYQLIYSNSSAITAYITPQINLNNYGVTLTQLGYGSITIKLSAYNSASTVTTNNVDHTISKGSSITIKRVTNDTFLISPVFFCLVP